MMLEPQAKTLEANWMCSCLPIPIWRHCEKVLMLECDLAIRDEQVHCSFPNSLAPSLDWRYILCPTLCLQRQGESVFVGFRTTW